MRRRIRVCEGVYRIASFGCVRICVGLGLGCKHTDAMKRPNAPPRAKPITPETAVLPGHDSIRACICRCLR